MIDTINLFHAKDLIPEIGQESIEQYDEINCKTRPEGSAAYKTVKLLGDKVKLIHSERRSSQDNCPATVKRFINIQSLVYLLPELTNLATVSPETLKRAFKALQDLLDAAGIEFDVLNAKLSRLDLTITVETTNPFIYYLPLFRSYTPKSYKRYEYDGTGFTFKKNNHNSLSIYDKFEQLKLDAENLQSIKQIHGLKTNNWLRFEHQYRDGREILKNLKITTVRDLIQNADRIQSKIKQEFTSWLPVATDYAQFLNLNKQEIESRILEQHPKKAEGILSRLTVLRAANYNTAEALKRICHEQNITHKKTIARERDRIAEALRVERIISHAAYVPVAEELRQKLNKPIWL